MPPEICLICFSSNRKLTGINQTQMNLLRLLLEDPAFEFPGSGPPSLCRECERRLLNVSQFKALVTNRMAIYKNYLRSGNVKQLSSKPNLQYTTDKNMFVVQHYEAPQSSNGTEVSLEKHEDKKVHEVLVKCEIEEVPIDAEELTTYLEITVPKRLKIETTIDEANSTIDNTSDQYEEENNDQETSKSDKNYYVTVNPRGLPQHRYKHKGFLTIWATDEEAKTWYDTEKDKFTNIEPEQTEYDPTVIRRKLTRCKMCNNRFESISKIYEHYKEHYIHYGCKACRYKTRTLEDITLHCEQYKHKENEATDDTKYKLCQKCGMAFTKVAHVNRHRIQCYGHSFPCQHCGKTFSLRTSRNCHVMLNHKNLEEETCDVCGKVCKNILALKQHKWYHKLEENGEALYCAPCGTQFTTKFSLEHHLKTSLKHRNKEDIYKIQCPQCPAKVRTAAVLKRHVDAVHLGIRRPRAKKDTRDVVCEICGSGFKTKSTLRNHMRLHSSERPFKCDQCASTFKFQAALYTHKKLVHLKQKRNTKKKKSEENSD